MFLSDKDASGTIDYKEFENFVKLNIKELFDVFDEIDKNKDGFLDPEEVRNNPGILCHKSDPNTPSGETQYQQNL